MNANIGVIITFGLLQLACANAIAQTSVPHDFQSGQPARASEVNENFDALETAIDQNAAEIQQIQGFSGLSPEARQIQTGLDLTSGLRWLVADLYRSQGRFPVDNSEVGAGAPQTWSNRFVQSAEIRPNSVIAIRFRSDAAPQLADREVYLTPMDPGSVTVWFDCSGDGTTDSFVSELDCAFSDPPYAPIYNPRQQILTAFDLLAQSDAQQSIQDFYNTNGTWPADNSQSGLGNPDTYQNHYITQLVVSSGGVITVTFGGMANYRISGGTLSRAPQDNGNSIQWTCSSPDIFNVYLPPVCRS